MMKYTSIMWTIFNMYLKYERYEDDKCVGCLAPADCKCEDCCITARKDEIAKEILEEMKEYLEKEL